MIMKISNLPIELLWIIPVVVIALLILMLIIKLQKRTVGEASPDTVQDLNREVKEYNSGLSLPKEITAETAEVRLNEIENTIQLVSKALSSQQRIIENFQGKDDKVEMELNELKRRLKELQYEYDITISENYTLRARLKRLETGDSRIKENSVLPGGNQVLNVLDENGVELGEKNKIIDMKLYDNSRKLSTQQAPELDDTSEINISEYR